MANPRGRIVCPSGDVDIGGGLVWTGRKLGIVVYLRHRTDTLDPSNLRREFRRFCSRHGVHPESVYATDDAAPGGRPDAYLCVGTLDGLERLASHPIVRDWHYPLDVKPPRGGMGTGPEKPRSTSKPSARLTTTNISPLTGLITADQHTVRKGAGNPGRMEYETPASKPRPAADIGPIPADLQLAPPPAVEPYSPDRVQYAYGRDGTGDCPASL